MVAIPAMRYIVVRKQNTEALKQFKILAPVITIGRTSENSIALKDNTVSRQHCAIETSKGVTRIRDLGSFHGFLINDKQSREAVLKHGDRIILGTFELFYVIKEDEPDPLSEGGVTQNRPPPAAPEAEPVSNGEAAEAPEDEAASPMEGEFVTEQDIPDASQPPEQSPEQSPEQPEAPDQYRSPLHNVIKSTQTLNDDSDLGIEMQTGDFPLPATPSDDVEDDASQDDDLDLNAILEDEEDSPKAPAPPSSRPPATKNAPPKTNVPSASNGSTDQSMAEADAHIKQLQIEFGDLLKRFESNKVQLSKSIEGLEAEKLKSDTAIRKYKRALEKIGAQENELIETRESIKGLESDATQSLKEYNELDERLHKAEKHRDDNAAKANDLESTFQRSEDARNDAQNKLTALEKIREDLDSDVQKFQAENRIARKKIATLETNLNTVQESRMRAKNLAMTLEKERDEAQNHLDGITKERDTHHTRSVKLEDELSSALSDHAKTEEKFFEVKKTSMSHSEQVKLLETKLSAARDSISDLEEEMEDSRQHLTDKLSASAAASTGIDEDKIKRKLGSMEKQRRQALALAEQVKKQLMGAQQQATVLQSFLDDREAQVKKLKNKLRKYESVDEDSKGD